MPAKHMILFGAGMTGRGQVAQLAHEAGWRLTLVDTDADLIRKLKDAGNYKVRLLGADGTHDVVVSGYEALHVKEVEPLRAAMSDADLVVTSVLEPNLRDAARTIAHVLPHRLESGVPLNIIAAENMSNGSTVLGQYVRAFLSEPLRAVLDGNVGFPDSMVARVVPVAQDPLLILGEEYTEWTADRNAVVGAPPELAGLEWVEDQTARLQRKLFIHNGGHVVCGNLGWLGGYHYIHEAAQDSGILRRVAQATSDAGAAVCAEHGFERDEMRAYEQNLLDRLVITALPDEIRRVIRQPIRKLGKGERLVGPLMLCEKHGLPHEGLCFGIAAVLRGRMSDDSQCARLAETVERLGLVQALAALVAYEPSPEAAAQIEQAYQELTHG